ncbi:hypothetical protein IWQ56_005472, partial [Coemansia nantahalensis]
MPDKRAASRASLAQTAAAVDDRESASPDEAAVGGKADGDVDETRRAGPIAMSLTRKLVICLSLALTMLLASLDFTIVTTAVPKISLEFHALSEATWIATAYMLTTTALQPLYG